MMAQQVVLKAWGVASGPSSDVVVGCASSVAQIDISSSPVDYNLADWQRIATAYNLEVIDEVPTRIDRQLDANSKSLEEQFHKNDPKRKREPDN